MRERQAILTAWRRARDAGQAAVLATVVRVEGSSYRHVGARMLVLEHGERVGGVSGGCLEQDVTKKAHWLTAEGPAVARFSTRSDDETRPYGMGCEGVVHVLLERLDPEQRNEAMELLEACAEARAPGVLATVIGARGHVGARLVLWPDGRATGGLGDVELDRRMEQDARDCLKGASNERSYAWCGEPLEVLFERVEAPRSLIVLGAGDDAMPVVRIAKELGWHVTVADGRAHFASRARFPQADLVVVTEPGAPLAGVAVPRGAACVVMSHSFEQDRAALVALAPLCLGYLGLLGPRARRAALLEATGTLQFACATGLHGPVGLDIGSETPEEVALAIVAEAHACLAGRLGGSLCDTRRDATLADPTRSRASAAR